MILYHLDKLKYKDVWPPEGTLFADGRWNNPGQWVIYSSPTVSLAKLEILANENNLPLERVCMTIEVTETAKVFEFENNELPKNWMDQPYPSSLSQITSRFINSDMILMKVPSAQCLREYNYLISVRHADFNELVKLLDVSEEPFDPRLRKTIRTQ